MWRCPRRCWLTAASCCHMATPRLRSRWPAWEYSCSADGGAALCHRLVALWPPGLAQADRSGATPAPRCTSPLPCSPRSGWSASCGRWRSASWCARATGCGAWASSIPPSRSASMSRSTSWRVPRSAPARLPCIWRRCAAARQARVRQRSRPPRSGAIQAIPQLLVPSITLYEVYRRMDVQRGRGFAQEAVAQMMQGRVVDLDAQTALTAAQLSRMRICRWPIVFILATARLHWAALWTQDDDFEGRAGVHFLCKSAAK